MNAKENLTSSAITGSDRIQNYVSFQGGQNCLTCGGLIMEPDKIYGYAGKVCYCKFQQNNTWIPYWSPDRTTITTTNSDPTYEPFLTVDKVENGFIVTKNGKEYIAKTAEEVLEYLKDE